MSLFASIYESAENISGMYDARFDLIFQHLYINGGYDTFGIIFILVSLGITALFYYVWKYPYARKIHWFSMLGLVFVIVFGITWGYAGSEILSPTNNVDLINALNDPNSGFMEFAEGLPIKYALINSIYSLIVAVLVSFLMQLNSKVQKHLPF